MDARQLLSNAPGPAKSRRMRAGPGSGRSRVLEELDAAGQRLQLPPRISSHVIP
jgi:hypothetical protein